MKARPTRARAVPGFIRPGSVCVVLGAVVLGSVVLSACALLPSPAERWAAADTLATARGWQGRRIEAGAFALQAWLPATVAPGAELTVYVEGDGYAWLSRSQPSTDPTPRHALALRLALAHGSGNVAYLGRPCQYIDAEASGCDSKYWTTHRFAPEVIEATDRAIETLKQAFAATRLTLVAYSGGGAVAALVAARRQDVRRLITVAGNLDHVAWTTHHRILPLSGSLNPADATAALGAVDQVHFVGVEDRIVPALVAERYAARFPSAVRPRIVAVGGQGHDCCWADIWPRLLQQLR